jgi:serine/threonine-protein kinase
MVSLRTAPDPVVAFSLSSNPSTDDSPDLVGATLAGGFRIVRHVAEGSMGHVYEATPPLPSDPGAKTPERVAVKVLHTSLLSQREVAFRFRREGEILDSIRSPHVPRLLARGRDARGRPFMVLDFVEGVVLSEILAVRAPLPTDEALELAAQLCRALTAAHAAGIVHRDMKPDNVIVGGTRERPMVHVLDFSVSKSEDLHWTQAGIVFGTPAYMPPEQARGDEITPLVDVYAVGAILYEMLTGKPPFDPTDPGKTLLALLTQDPPRPRDLRPEISVDVERLVLKAIAKEPKNRFPLIESLAAALESQAKSSAASERDARDDADQIELDERRASLGETDAAVSMRDSSTPTTATADNASSRRLRWLVIACAVGGAILVLVALLRR